MADLCPRCDDTCKLGKHYILPMKEAGSNDKGNVIFLCAHCRDIACLMKLRCKQDILEWNTTYINAEARMLRPWYRQVYGSAQSP